jgi:hypothetical protein
MCVLSVGKLLALAWRDGNDFAIITFLNDSRELITIKK